MGLKAIQYRGSNALPSKVAFPRTWMKLVSSISARRRHSHSCARERQKCEDRKSAVVLRSFTNAAAPPLKRKIKDNQRGTVRAVFAHVRWEISQCRATAAAESWRRNAHTTKIFNKDDMSEGEGEGEGVVPLVYRDAEECVHCRRSIAPPTIRRRKKKNM